MAGYLNEDVQKWYKENKDLIGVIETLTKRCKELEKKADLANTEALEWEHKFFVESARYDELIDTASKLDLENYKMKKSLEEAKNLEITRSQQIEKLEKEIESQKQMAHNRKRYDYIHHFDHVNKLSCRIKDLEKEVEKYKNEVRKLNAACKDKNSEINALANKLFLKEVEEKCNFYVRYTGKMVTAEVFNKMINGEDNVVDSFWEEHTSDIY